MLADLNLGLDPFTNSRYGFAGGNPITGIELDGHMLIAEGGGGSMCADEAGHSYPCSQGLSGAPTATAASDEPNRLVSAWYNLQGFFGEGSRAWQNTPSWLKTTLLTWDDLETASATNIGADRSEQEAAADRVANTTFGRIMGLTDARQCDLGDTDACRGTAAEGVLTFGLGKLFRLAKAIRAELALNAAARGFGGLSCAREFGIAPYRELRRTHAVTGLQAHHLIEKRFANIMGVAERDMLSIAVTESEHQAFTNAWRRLTPYGEGTQYATKAQILEAARRVYTDYPSILSALGL